MIGSTNIKHGGTKSIMIISVDSGSTVAVYSNAECTTKVKDAIEKNEGEFWVTNLNDGDYYIKATNSDNTKTTILPYRINEYGVYRITIMYIPDQVVHYTMLYDGSLGNSTTNQCSSLTGGWAQTGYSVNSTYYKNGSLTFTATDMRGTTSTTDGQLYFAGMQTPIDASNYVGLFLNTLPSSTAGVCGYFHNTDRFKFTRANRTNIASSSVKTITYEDISEVTRDSFVVLACVGRDSNSGKTAYYYNIGLDNADDTAALATALSLSNNTTDTILASSSDIGILLGSERAVRWMCANCTGDFMAKAVQTEAFITAYVSSPYKSIIDANAHWAKFLAMVA